MEYFKSKLSVEVPSSWIFSVVFSVWLKTPPSNIRPEGEAQFVCPFLIMIIFINKDSGKYPLLTWYLSIKLPALSQGSCCLPAGICQSEAGCVVCLVPTAIGSYIGSSTTQHHLLHGVQKSLDRQVWQRAVMASWGFKHLHWLINTARWIATRYYQS